MISGGVQILKYIRVLAMMTLLCVLLCASILFADASIGFDAETAYDSVFVITAGNSLGSGFAVGEDCVITNVHVVENASSVLVTTYSGQKYRASVFCMDRQLDVAILAVDGANFTPLLPADFSGTKIGDDVYTIGAPNNLAYTLTKGVISAKSRQMNGNDYIQIDAPINEGNSGGPLLDDTGKVLGINTLKYSDSEGLGFAIPFSEVQVLMKTAGVELNTDGTVSGRISGSTPEEPETSTPQQSESESDISETVSPKSSEITEHPNGKQTIGPILFGILLSAAVITAIVLLIVQKKRSHVERPYDRSERTDFEIEIED